MMLQDFLSTPELREVLVSKDAQGVDPAGRPRGRVGYARVLCRLHAGLEHVDRPSQEPP